MHPTLHPEATLAEIVTAHPDLARELEGRGLDYCCGGTRTLADACTAHQLDLASTLGALVAAAAPQQEADWPRMGPAALVDHLEATHHAYLWDELPRLGALLAKVVGVHGERHPELVDVARVFDELRADLEPHLRKEELVLFPLVRTLEADPRSPAFHCGSVRNPVTVMRVEHDRAGELLSMLRTLTSGYEAPPDGCASYAALYRGLLHLEHDTHLHIHKENNVLFPAVVRLEEERLAAH